MRGFASATCWAADQREPIANYFPGNGRSWSCECRDAAYDLWRIDGAMMMILVGWAAARRVVACWALRDNIGGQHQKHQAIDRPAGSRKACSAARAIVCARLRGKRPTASQSGDVARPVGRGSVTCCGCDRFTEKCAEEVADNYGQHAQTRLFILSAAWPC